MTRPTNTVVTVPLIFTVPTAEFADEYDIPVAETPAYILDAIKRSVEPVDGIIAILKPAWPMMRDYVSIGAAQAAAEDASPAAVEDLTLVDEDVLYARVRALNDEIARRNDNELFEEVCKVLATLYADPDMVPVEVRFPTMEYDDGYFFHELDATVIFADGDKETGVAFPDAEDALRALSDLGGTLGATSGLSINVKTGDTDTDDYMFND